MAKRGRGEYRRESAQTYVLAKYSTLMIVWKEGADLCK